jgi:FtsP/CotA-like multicopper oxidase with cupredoxin domain
VAPFAPRGPHQHYAQYPAQKYYVLTAKEQEHSFHPELPDARIWGYDGIVPGPTLDARYGQPILLRIRNELPAAHTGFGIPQLITHLHNFHTASESDGGPWDWTDRAATPTTTTA